jgi:hypothetical protein
MLLIWESNKIKYNFFFFLDDTDTENKKMNDANTEKLNDIVSEPSSDTNWCKPHDHVVTQPTIKIEIWSRKAEIGLIGVWHNGNLPQGTNTIGMK